MPGLFEKVKSINLIYQPILNWYTYEHDWLGGGGRERARINIVRMDFTEVNDFTLSFRFR